MSRKLTLDSLIDPHSYALQRQAFREAVMAHKQARRVPLGEHAELCFEDFMTMKYQVQEMIRVEKITAPADLQEELDAYNPLIPDGANWKATLLLEYADVDARKAALAALVGIEEQLWVKVGEHRKVYAVANEDLQRSTDEKTSAVHFLRFELSAAMVADAKRGVAIWLGCDHPGYRVGPCRVAKETAQLLAMDLV